MTVHALVVADDRSGACDTGHQFAARGYGTAVVGRGEATDPDVLVVDTDSRYVEADTAADRVREVFASTDAARVYKKVDSTLRGNVVVEVEAAVDAAGADVAVVAPAFPAEGRTTVGGYHLVDGTPVAETTAGSDPDAPVDTSHLPTRFGGVTGEVAHVDLDAVGDASTVADRVADAAGGDRPAIVTCDATADDHLAAIARGAAATALDVVYVGSAGLARHVRLEEESGGVLGVVGSASPRTFTQLEALPDSQVVHVDGPALVTNRADVVASVTNLARKRLDADGAVVVTAAESPGDVETTLEAAAEEGLSPSTARDRIVAGLAAVAAGITDESSPRGYLLSGGAVATATLDALGATGVRLTGSAVADGVPVGRVVEGTAAGRPLVTKAGAFGDRKTIDNCLGFLAGYDA